MESTTQPQSNIKSSSLDMKNIFIGALLLIIGLIGGYLIASKSSAKPQNTNTTMYPTPTMALSPTSDSTTNTNYQKPTVVMLSPTDTAQNFYVNYNTCITNEDRNPSGKNRIEVCGEKYKQYLTSSLYEVLKSHYNLPDDPLLCSQAYYDSSSIQAKEISTQGKNAIVIVYATHLGAGQPSHMNVNLIEENNQWLLDNVECSRF